MLIMSIGLVSVATMFPISVQRTVHANFLTNATVLRNNVEAFLDFYPNVIDNAPFRNIDLVNPANSRSGISWIDPLGYVVVAGNPNGTPHPANPNLLAFPPPAGINALYVGRTNQLSGPGFEHFGIRRVPGFVPFVFPNFPPAHSAQRIAEGIAALPDTWSERVYEGVPSIMSADTDPLVLSMDGLQNAIPAGGLSLSLNHRAILFGGNARLTVTLPVAPTNIVGNSISFGANTLAVRNQLGGVLTNARIETQTSRFTWFATVRKDGIGPAQCYVAVVHNRGMAQEDYTVGPTSPYLYPDEQPWPVVYTRGSRVAILPGPRPQALRRGGWIFDGDNGVWYRCVNFTDRGVSVDITIDRPAQFSTPDPVPGLGAGDGLPWLSVGSIIMRGIIDVFPIGLKGSSL
jgi:hypothetical protein